VDKFHYHSQTHQHQQNWIWNSDPCRLSSALGLIWSPPKKRKVNKLWLTAREEKKQSRCLNPSHLGARGKEKAKATRTNPRCGSVIRSGGFLCLHGRHVMQICRFEGANATYDCCLMGANSWGRRGGVLCLR